MRVSGVISVLFFICLIFSFFAFINKIPIAYAENGKDWVNLPNSKDTHSTEINSTNIYQVVPTKEGDAIFTLKDLSIEKITEKEAKWYTGHYYVCEKGKQPYLVRAVYGRGGTGDYSVQKTGNNLLIIHSSLGKSSVLTKSALILNLDFEPKEVYIKANIAE
jgi:hypothetical protein